MSFFFSLNDQNPAYLFWFPLYSGCFAWSITSLAHIQFKWAARTLEKKEADCIGSQWQQKLGGKGLRLAIGFDVNFIVNNYESRGHYGSISTPTVSPFVEPTELHSQMQHLSWSKPIRLKLSSDFVLGGSLSPALAHRKSVHWMNFRIIAPSNYQSNSADAFISSKRIVTTLSYLCLFFFFHREYVIKCHS